MSVGSLPVVVAISGEVMLGVAIAIILFGVVFGYYSRSGTEISQHPQGAGRSEAPGVGEGQSRIAGSDDGEQDSFDSHGAK